GAGKLGHGVLLGCPYGSENHSHLQLTVASVPIACAQGLVPGWDCQTSAVSCPAQQAAEELDMGLMDFIKKQFIDVIQWTEDDHGTLAWRFPMAGMEIQYGAALTVRDAQMAVFVNEGRIADVLGPGMARLTTQTVPVLTYLKNWDKL